MTVASDDANKAEKQKTKGIWRKKHIAKNKTRVNTQIIASQIRLISEDGGQLGVVSLKDALNEAKTHGLDLVEIAPNEDPPVCRIMDFGKYKFSRSKKQKGPKHKVHLKEIQFRPTTDVGDYQVKMRKVMAFLKRGDKVKITLRFKGREMQHRELAIELLKRINDDLKEIAGIEQQPKMEGRQATMVVVP